MTGLPSGSDDPGSDDPGGDDPGGRRRVTGSFTRSLLEATARGGGLVALAVVVGVVLLQLSDTSGPDPLPAASTGPPAVQDDDSQRPSSSTTTTAPPRDPANVKVLVLNAAGRGGAAGAMSERLEVVGYPTLTPGNAPVQERSLVACRDGLDREAAALGSATGISPGKAPFAAMAKLEGSAEADCVVVVGSG